MKVKRFVVPSMQVGLKQVGETLGPGAVILSNRRLAEGMEIVAGVEEAELAAYQASRPAAKDPNAIIKASGEARKAPGLDQDSMKSLLEAMAPKNKAAFQRPQPIKAPQHSQHSPQSSVHSRPPITSITEDQRPAAVAEVPSASTALLPATDELMALMRQEIAGLKTMLEQQTDLLREPALPKMSPSLERIEARLGELGFSQTIQRSLLRHYDGELPLDTNWRRLMGRLSAGLATPLIDPVKEGGIIALCGPTGAGKTTTLAKMAARYVKDYGAEDLAIVSADYFQMGAQTSLASVARILGVEFVALQDGQPLAEVLDRLKHKHLVLIDTSGSQDALKQWQVEVVATGLEKRLATVMVLPATAHEASLKQFIARFPGRSLAGAVLTKLDEAPCFGSLFDCLLRYRWPIWYCSAGQNIPRDLERCEPTVLVKRLMRTLNQNVSSMAKAG